MASHRLYLRKITCRFNEGGVGCGGRVVGCVLWVGRSDVGRFGVGRFGVGRFGVGRFGVGRFGVGRFDVGRFDVGRFDVSALDVRTLDGARSALGYESPDSPSPRFPVSPLPRLLVSSLHRSRSTPAEGCPADGQRQSDPDPTPSPRFSVSSSLPLIDSAAPR
jgi:hypothetical protein